MTALADQLRRLGFSAEQIAAATVNGQPLADVPERPNRLPPKRKDLADAFCALWDRIGDGTRYEREYRFAPPRRWRFDVAFVRAKVAVELEGGVWSRGRHTRPKGYRADCEKYNAAQLLGWKVLRFVSNDITESPVQVVEAVRAAMEG